MVSLSAVTVTTVAHATSASKPFNTDFYIVLATVVPIFMLPLVFQARARLVERLDPDDDLGHRAMARWMVVGPA